MYDFCMSLILNRNVIVFGVGIGYVSVVIVQFFNIYYIVIFGWVLFYLFVLFIFKLLWFYCDNLWNISQCVDLSGVGLGFLDSSGQNVFILGMLNVILNVIFNVIF